MLSLGALAFATPWVLAALAVLPAIWWLIRITPPAPKRVRFPALVFLLGLQSTEETAAKTPWWLVLLRVLVAALIVFGLARPLLNPSDTLPGTGPVLVVFDDGWAAAPEFEEKRRVALDLLDRAEREGRLALLLTTARPSADDALDLFGPRRARDVAERVQSLQPKPWPGDRQAAADVLRQARLSGGTAVVYLSDGLDAPGTEPLLTELAGLGPVRLLEPLGARLPRLLLPPEGGPGDLVLTVARAVGEGGDTGARGDDIVAVRALAGDGRVLARETVTFSGADREKPVTLRLPTELRNQVVRLDLENASHVGGVVLFDERFRRRPVGLTAAGSLDAAQSLLDDAYYLERALLPFAEIRRGALGDLLRNPPSILLLPDSEPLTADLRAALNRYVQQGGVLVRFAGPRLAASSGMAAESGASQPDDLVPVRLRDGGRSLGTALQWTEPARLAAFPDASPFKGLAIPGDVTITRQVLAEPAPDLAERTWARLADGTPLVTGQMRGDGVLVLFHVPATAVWSSLPISGLFVDMLRRLAQLGRGVAGGDSAQAAPPLQTLDGFGRLVPALSGAAPLPPASAAAAERQVSPRHPPGFYGTETARVAQNLTAGTVTRIAPLGAVPQTIQRETVTQNRETDLKPWLLGAALILLLVDGVIALVLRGYWAAGRSVAAAARGIAILAVATGLGLGLLAFGSGTAFAQARGGQGSGGQTAEPDMDFAIKATVETRLAYVLTGDPTVDDISAAGMRGLAAILGRRTAVDAADPMAVDLERDELAFFSLIYWPMTEAQAPLSRLAVDRINFFLRNGGTILFDTRDGGLSGPGGSAADGAGARLLQRLAEGLEIPPLAPVGPEHVLTKTFYLLPDFPGRDVGAPLWVQSEARGIDEVSSVIVGGNDYAAAWAVDASGRPILPVSPGGEVQREMAYRFGINLVMYALTGNYKADQIHVPAILERLGQ